ncbi:hypothetical protein KIPB_010558, partial [Kipferlia bialata]
NVQNGVLKSLSFLFEYVAELGCDYVYAITPLLVDALTDRDEYHRQAACEVVRHIALNVAGLGRKDAVVHLLNHAFPNILEGAPHMVQAMLNAVQGCRAALGNGFLLSYFLPGLFHPAQRVRSIYWQSFNHSLIDGTDDLVPFYPRMDVLDTPLEEVASRSTLAALPQVEATVKGRAHVARVGAKRQRQREAAGKGSVVDRMFREGEAEAREYVFGDTVSGIDWYEDIVPTTRKPKHRYRHYGRPELDMML